jgi:glutathione synthase/RimK-type ligase-like ATP-grasp enzyme
MPKDDWLKVAILHDKTARYSPSNDSALHAFSESAARNNIYTTVIGKSDIDLLPNFDGLLIRATTHPGDTTYEFASLAEYLGMKVIDSCKAIQIGCNKIYQIEQFKKFNIPHPKTWLDDYSLGHEYWDRGILFPCVVKIPDSCFSQGVFKVKNIDEYKAILHDTRYENTKVCQEFIETKFDWRITVFNHSILFAMKYYMADEDWKIIKYDRNGEYITGKHECVKIEDIPTCVLVAAAKCDVIIDHGLYGIDIKEVDGKAYVIEINDNASIDASVEDGLEGEKIYATIMRYFLRQP